MDRKRTDTVPHYDLEALRQNIQRCDQNITLWQEAIQKEYQNKAELLKLIKETEDANLQLQQSKQDNHG